MVCLYYLPLDPILYFSISFHISIPWNWVCMRCNYYVINDNQICCDSTRIVVRCFLLVISLTSKKHRVLVRINYRLDKDLFSLLNIRILQVRLRCLFGLAPQTTNHSWNPLRKWQLDPIMVCFLSCFDLNSSS